MADGLKDDDDFPKCTECGGMACFATGNGWLCSYHYELQKYDISGEELRDVG